MKKSEQTQNEMKVKELVKQAIFRLNDGAWRRALHHLQRAEEIARTYDPF